MTEITVLVGLIGGLLSIVAYFTGRDKAAKEDGKSDGIMLKDIEHIKNSIDSMSGNLKEANSNMVCIDKVVTSNTFKISVIERDLKETREEINTLKEELGNVKKSVLN